MTNTETTRTYNLMIQVMDNGNWLELPMSLDATEEQVTSAAKAYTERFPNVRALRREGNTNRWVIIAEFKEGEAK